MGQSGDAPAEKPRVTSGAEGNGEPVIERDVSPAAADASTIADEAVEDATTQIVPQASLTPPPSVPPRHNGTPAPLHSPRTFAPSDSPASSASSAVQPWQPGPHVVPVIADQQSPRPGQVTHAPFHTAPSWGATTFVITAETAAGFSYLFWWISGLLVYFNERENRYVRFHAVQSILLTGALSVFSVAAFLIAALFNTLFLSNHQPIWQAFSLWTVVLWLLIVLFVWLATMIAAWTGAYLRLPIIGDYAERFAAPPIQIRP